MEALIVSLLAWLAANSNYPALALPPPRVELVSAEDLTARYERESGRTDSRRGAHVLGYFAWDEGASGTIYLTVPPDPSGTPAAADPIDNPWFRERLLHELVHYAQYHSGAYARFACPSRGELDAYRLGGLYLRQLGVADPIPARPNLARWYSRC